MANKVQYSDIFTEEFQKQINENILNKIIEYKSEVERVYILLCEKEKELKNGK